jgi:hypothetical protein
MNSNTRRRKLELNMVLFRVRVATLVDWLGRDHVEQQLGRVSEESTQYNGWDFERESHLHINLGTPGIDEAAGLDDGWEILRGALDKGLNYVPAVLSGELETAVAAGLISNQQLVKFQRNQAPAYA